MLHKQNFPSGKQDPPEIQRSSAEKTHLRGDGATGGYPVGNACTPVAPSPALYNQKSPHGQAQVDTSCDHASALIPACSDDVPQHYFFDVIQAKQDSSNRLILPTVIFFPLVVLITQNGVRSIYILMFNSFIKYRAGD